ncbi:MAG: hypothetical protein ACK44D_12235 [Bacteroidia bacterium]
MKNTLAILLILAISSCTMGKFDRYPGQAQRVFPSQMIGTYYLIIPTSIAGKKTAGTDSLFYTITENSIIVKDSSKIETKPLDNNQVLSLVQNKYYVLSTKDTEDPDYWNCMVHVADKKGLTIYPAIDENKNTDLKNFFKRKYLRLNDNNDSVFVYEMHDANFVRYVNKALKGNHSIKLKKLTPNTIN